MIKITMQPTVDMDNICKELGLHMSDFECTQMVANDSYIIFDCSDERVEELSEDLELEKDKGDIHYFNRISNDYALMNLLRAQGIFDSALIYVSW
jgi:hypothetical protein